MSQSTLIVTILGSGGSPGVPMPGCACNVCQSTDPLDQRTRCSALLGYAGRNVLIDMATDLRQQALREQLQKIDAVLLTHTHADHLHGIDDLRPFNRHVAGPIPIYAAAPDVAHLQRVFPYIFSDDLGEGYRPQLETRCFAGPFMLFGEQIVPIPLQHGRGVSYGFRLGAFAYLTDCSAIPEASYALLSGVTTLVIDGLRFRPHITHFNVPEAMAAAERIGAEQTWLTHLNHEISHQHHGRQLPPGIAFAYDGLKIRLPITTGIA
jgi:phosphoribosyl 1,2-cyclic phosphate phosphodiesterase